MYVCCCCCCCVCLDHHTTAHKERHKRRVRVLLYSAVDGSTRRTGPLLIARGGAGVGWTERHTSPSLFRAPVAAARSRKCGTRGGLQLQPSSLPQPQASPWPWSSRCGHADQTDREVETRESRIPGEFGWAGLVDRACLVFGTGERESVVWSCWLAPGLDRWMICVLYARGSACLMRDQLGSTRTWKPEADELFITSATK